MLTPQEYQLLDHLSQYVTEHKKQFIERVLSCRTRQVTVVMEDIYQSQNASAVVRTCEGMGLQDIYVIESNSTYQVNKKVLKGSNKWIDLLRYRKKDANNTEECFSDLRGKGYKIIGMDPAPDGISIHELDASKHKCALVFGNEFKGLSPYAMDNCDMKASIPMHGFTESYNISVSAAIALTTLLTKLRAGGCDYGLTKEEMDAIRLLWIRKIVRRSDIMAQEFIRTNR